MKKLKSFISIIFSGLALAICSWLFFFGQPSLSHRIAYVRSSELIYKYLGMKDAQNKYQQKTQSWQTNIDTLQSDLQLAVSKYNTESRSLTKEERAIREKMLQEQQNNLVEYGKTINKKAKDEDDKITEGVLNQINSFVEQYGKENGYDIILGTTLSGNVLYGDNAIDITDVILTQMNKNYTGKEVASNEN